MKAFSRTGYRIGKAPAETKWVYTFFLIFLLIGFFTIGGYEFRQIGFDSAAVMQHFRGAEESADGGLAFAKPFSALLETTHFHAFMMGIIYLTLAHLFLATELKRGTKMAIVVVGFVATLLDLLLPWAIRYLSPHFSPILIAAWIGEWISYMAMIGVSLFDLWLRPSTRDGGD